MLKSVAGRPMPFTVKRFPSLPIHSRRVGIRHVPSIGGKVLCNVDIVVQVDSTPNASHMVTIDGVNYNNGDTAVLELGDHTLTWASGNEAVFTSWGTSGKLSVEDSGAATTVLTVTCGGTLTLTLGLEEILNVDDFDEDVDQFTHFGDAPYLDAADDGNSCGQRDTCGARQMSWFTFENLSALTSFSKVTLFVRFKATTVAYNETLWVALYKTADHSDGISKSFNVQRNGVDHTKYGYYAEWDVSAFFTTVGEVNLASMALWVNAFSCFIEVDHAYLKVEA